MKPVDEGLFAHIKESLTEHEEAYSPGAWERFDQKQNRKSGWLWYARLGGIAAALLIGLFVFLAQEATTNLAPIKPTGANVITPNTNAVDNVPSEDQNPMNAVRNVGNQPGKSITLARQAKNKHKSGRPSIVTAQSETAVSSVAIPRNPAAGILTNSLENIEAILPYENLTGKSDFEIAGLNDSIAIAKKTIDAPTTDLPNPARSFQEFLESEVRKGSTIAAAKVTAKKPDKWDMGLMIAPSIGNGKRLNMGYGLSMGYAVSDKVSITSGISYSALTASRTVTGNEFTQNAPANMALVSDTKSLESVDANLAGIDIPLGIKYYLTKKFYTNLGVSAFAVINQKQSNNYLQGAIEHNVEDATSKHGFNAVFQTRTVSEVVPSAEIRDDRYLGFYNISFGFQQKISGGKAFSVEPFLKLPMKEFTSENLYLMGTGLRLKFDF